MAGGVVTPGEWTHVAVVYGGRPRGLGLDQIV